jgi:hypothetical protein
VGADDYGTGSGEMAVTSNSRLCAGCGTLVILLALLAVPHTLAAAAGRSYDVSNPLALHTGLGTAARPVAPASEGSSFRSGISSSRGGAKADVTQWRIQPPLTDYSEGEGALASQGFLTAKERAVRAVVGVIAAAACSSVLLLGAYLLALAARPDQGDVVTRFSLSTATRVSLST